MAWYSSGTISLTNGSTTITGAGVAWLGIVQPGYGIILPGAQVNEIAQVNGNAQMTMARPWSGGTASGQSYTILPTASFARDLSDAVTALITTFAGVRDGIGRGLIPDGTSARPALRFLNDQDSGIHRAGANMWVLGSGGADRLFIGDAGVGVGSPPDDKAGLLVQGQDQSTSALADGGAHGASIMLRSIGYTAGDGGSVLFGTTFGNATPFAAVKGMVTDGAGGGQGDLVFSMRAAGSDPALTERARLTSRGDFGLGCTPKYQVHLKGSGQASMNVYDSGLPGGMLYLQDPDGAQYSGGALLLGSGSTPFASIKGALANGTGNTVGNLIFGTRESISATSITGRWLLTNDGTFTPIADNAYDLGGGASRVRTVYAGTGSINTSDARTKQQIGDVPPEWLDAWGHVRHVRFKFNDAVELKGDGARWHLGFIAQEIKTAFDAVGIDATRIGLLCHDTWDAETEAETETVTRMERTPRFTPSASLVGSDGTPLGTWSYDETPVDETRPTGRTVVTREAGDRWSLRYDECQAIESAWQRREIARQRTEIAALSARMT